MNEFPLVTFQTECVMLGNWHRRRWTWIAYFLLIFQFSSNRPVLRSILALTHAEIKLPSYFIIYKLWFDEKKKTAKKKKARTGHLGNEGKHEIIIINADNRTTPCSRRSEWKMAKGKKWNITISVNNRFAKGLSVVRRIACNRLMVYGQKKKEKVKVIAQFSLHFTVDSTIRRFDVVAPAATCNTTIHINSWNILQQQQKKRMERTFYSLYTVWCVSGTAAGAWV